MANNIPLYGANKAGGDLGDLQDFVEGSMKVAEYSANLAADASDVVVHTAAAQGTHMLGYSLYVSNVKGAAGDFQANIEVNSIDGPLTVAGQSGEVFGGGGELANTETVSIVLTGSAGNTADVRVIVWGSANTDLT